MCKSIAEQKEFVVGSQSDVDTRIDKWLADKIDSLSRTKIKKLIKAGSITVDEQEVKPAYDIKMSDTITVRIPEPETVSLEPENIPLDIIWEDENYLAVNKQSNLVVHPGAGHKSGTLVNGLLNYTHELSSAGGEKRPGLVHRLDKDTTGIIMVAKNDEAHWKLSEQFAQRKVYKEYRTFVWRVPKEKSGHIEKSIGRSRSNRTKFVVTPRGKYADTYYWLQKDYNVLSLLKLKLGTGRTHQVRVHMKYLGHPVIGDDKYGNDTRFIRSLNSHNNKVGRDIQKIITRQLLHAYKIKFYHPFKNKVIKITAPLPDDFRMVEQIVGERYYT